MKLKRFQKINIEISNICNLQCSFCPEMIREKKIMSVELFEKIIAQAAPLTELVCLHLMGDPLVHPKLEELVSICEKYQTKIFFVTNGVLFREFTENLLLLPSFHQISFSLHSFFDNFPNENPTRFLEKIFKFVDRALIERPALYINFRLCILSDTKGSLTQNAEILERIERHFDYKFDRELNLRVKKNSLIRGRLFLHFDTEFTWPSLDLPILGTKGTCYGLKSHFGILADGTVVPCCLDKEAAIPLGKIQDHSLLEILENSRSKAISKGFQERKLIEDLCQRCQYIERFQ